MTRINLVDPQVLSDKHLMAEYRELPRIFTAVKKLQAQGKKPVNVHIPDRYVLGEGHCKFFYNKLGWLRMRYVKLYDELKHRDYCVDRDLFDSVFSGINLIDPCWFGRFLPAPEEIYLNMARLAKRSKMDRVMEELNNAS